MTHPANDLPRWGLGTAPFGDFAEDAPARAEGIVVTALSNGVSLLDTAPLYGDGRSEALVGNALRGVPRSAFALTSKVGNIAIRNGTVQLALDPGSIRESVYRSLERLGVEYLDVLHLHEPAMQNPAVALEGRLDTIFATLELLREEGLTRRIGVGLNDVALASVLIEREGIDCILLASRLTLLENTGAPVVARGEAIGLSTILGGIYNSGILATGPQEAATYEYASAPAIVRGRAAELQSACEDWGVPLNVAATAYVSRRAPRSTILFGARSVREVDDFVQARSFQIPDGLWIDIAKIHRSWGWSEI